MLNGATFGSDPVYQAPAVRLKPPSKLLLLAEWRALFELGYGVASVPALMLAKRGDGHPVLVLPGFLAGDPSTDLLRRYLGWLGYETHGWELGRNFGGVYSMRNKLRKRLTTIAEKSGRKVSIVGWSLGGIYARDLAHSLPESVRYVVTLGSPFSSDITATNASRLYEMLSGESVETMVPADRALLCADLPVPTTSFYTRTDGVVNWKTCLVEEGPHAENVEVCASHVGLGVNPAVLWGVADRLAQREGEFKRFDRLGPFALTYPR